jgi:hypothetical protein
MPPLAMTTESLSPRRRRTALESLSRGRVAELTERFELEVADKRVHAAHVDALIKSRSVSFGDVLAQLARDELKTMCEALGLDATGREKQVLIDRVLLSDGRKSNAPATSAQGSTATPSPTPARSEPPRTAAAKRAVERIAGAPSTRGLLSVLTKARLAQLARSFSVSLDAKLVKEAQLDALIGKPPTGGLDARSDLTT